LRTFLRPIPADIKLPERKESTLSLELEIIPDFLKHSITTINAIIFFKALDMILKGICY
jgi:hypothetical protein